MLLKCISLETTALQTLAFNFNCIKNQNRINLMTNSLAIFYTFLISTL